MKFKSCLSLLVLVSVGSALGAGPKVRTGIEVLRDRGFDVLRGKRVGLITNPTGVDSQLTSTIDILYKARGVKLAALFGPEHGVRGDFAAGERIKTTIDGATRLPVYSLYGETRKPKQEMLRGLDALVYDIQDIGCRSYTYISTMGVSMQAAAEAGIEFIVLDRPNPLGGLRIEGNLVQPGAESFVGKFPIPYVYGLTCGELARFLNEEGILGPQRCRLTVVPMQGWKREMTFPDTGLYWVPPSPHIPRADSSMFYVATGMMGELQVISEGVGYTLPFEVFAAEWINPDALCKELSKQKWEGVRFRPITYKAYYTGHKDKTLKGVQIHLTDDEGSRSAAADSPQGATRRGEDQGTGNREAAGNRDQGTGNRQEQGSGNREEGTGNRKTNTGNWKLETGNNATLNLMSIQFRLMEAHNRLYPDHNPFTVADAARISMFDKVSGGPRLRELFTQRMLYADVEPFLMKGAQEFRVKARKYYLY